MVGRCGKTEGEAARTSWHEYSLLLEGREAEHRERYELARWLAFRIYMMNPYIKPPRATGIRAYFRFPWEEQTEEEAKEAAKDCRVTEEEVNILEKIFADIENKRGTVQ